MNKDNSILSRLSHSFSFWLAAAVTANFILLSIRLADNSPWVFKLVPTLNGMTFPHLASALLIYMVSVVPYLVALVYFTRHVLIYMRGKTTVPIALKGLWTLSIIAFLSFAIAVAGFKYPHLRDPRLSASLTFMYSSVFLITGILSNLRIKK